jgi:hypothetical protein
MRRAKLPNVLEALVRCKSARRRARFAPWAALVQNFILVTLFLFRARG